MVFYQLDCLIIHQQPIQLQQLISQTTAVYRQMKPTIPIVPIQMHIIQHTVVILIIQMLMVHIHQLQIQDSNNLVFNQQPLTQITLIMESQIHLYYKIQI